MQSGNKKFGMTKHGKSGHTTQSPKFRHDRKLEAERNEIKDRSRIRDPKQSMDELFHGKEKC